jgi:endonuclease YncB( thermonuclease family)
VVALCIALAATLASAQAPQLRALVGTTFDAKVVGVVDGDTIDVLRAGNVKIRVRLEGIDCPESGEPFSQVARNFTRVLAFDQMVRVSGREVDQYGRLVARFGADSKDVSVELVTAGLACHYKRYSSDPALARAEADAKSHARGFWAASAEKPACVAREAGAIARPLLSSPATTNGRVIGNVSSHVYHLTTCRNATCKNCTRPFASRAAAEAAGFRPAGDCIRN